MDKSPDAFRTISEVASDLELPQHVLRFWETRFTQIKPLKRGGGRRYYRPDDVDLLRGIRHLLYGEGYTIKGVQRILREQGIRHVSTVWRGDDAPETAEAPPAAPQPPPQPAAHSQAPATAAEVPVEPEPSEPVPRDIVVDDASEGGGARSPFQFIKGRRSDEAGAAGDATISRDDIRGLQSTLFELLECKRLLDQSR